MNRIVKISILFLVVFVAFCVCGIVSTSIPSISENIVASTAVFGVSFITILGKITKLWYDLFV